MNGAGSPAGGSGTPQPLSIDGAAGAKQLPSAMRLLASAKRAFDAAKDAPSSARRVLTGSTSCKGFQGKHRTKRWCCRLSAVLDALEARGVLPDGPLAPYGTHFGLFVLVAQEMAWWERLRSKGMTSSARAHLSHFAVDVALRLGFLLGLRENNVASALLEPNPAWADSARRGEPIVRLMRAAGFCTQRDLWSSTELFTKDTVTGWVRHGVRPTPESIDHLSSALARRIPNAGASSLARGLSWHYALASLHSEIEQAFGSAFAGELARVFVAIASHAAANVRTARAAGQVDDRKAATFVFYSLRALPGVGPPECLLRHAGASEEFVADVKAAHSAWQVVVRPVRNIEREADLAVLLLDLPRLKPGERRKRRGCGSRAVH